MEKEMKVIVQDTLHNRVYGVFDNLDLFIDEFRNNLLKDGIKIRGYNLNGKIISIYTTTSNFHLCANYVELNKII